MSIKINTRAIKIVKSTFTRVVRLIIASRWQPLHLQFQTREAVTRLQIRIYNANLWPAGAVEIKIHYTTQDSEYWTGFWIQVQYSCGAHMSSVLLAFGQDFKAFQTFTQNMWSKTSVHEIFKRCICVWAVSTRNDKMSVLWMLISSWVMWPEQCSQLHSLL